MMIFWLVAILLIVSALLFLLPPLIKGKARGDTLDRDELNLTIFKDKLVELEADLAAGVLTQEQYETAKQDIERDFLQESGDEGEKAAAEQVDRVVGRAAAVVIALVIPIFAAGLYAMLGAGAAGLEPEKAAVEMQAEGHEGTLEEQVATLRKHLEEKPEDAEGWVMLARSYYFLKQFGPASQAYAKASALIQDSDPNLLADWADAAAMAQGR